MVYASYVNSTDNIMMQFSIFSFFHFFSRGQLGKIVYTKFSYCKYIYCSTSTRYIFYKYFISISSFSQVFKLFISSRSNSSLQYIVLHNPRKSRGLFFSAVRASAYKVHIHDKKMLDTRITYSLKFYILNWRT